MKCRKENDEFFEKEKKRFQYSWAFLQRSMNTCMRKALEKEKGKMEFDGKNKLFVKDEEGLENFIHSEEK